MKTAWLVICICVVSLPLYSQAAKRATQNKAVERGREAFGDYCATCHGEDATGGRGPDLIHSKKVLQDKRGEIIGPILDAGIPAKGMPALGLTKGQISDLVTFLHTQVKASSTVSQKSK